MNALSRDLSAAAGVSRAIARDLFGFATLPTASIDYHTMLAMPETGDGISLIDSTWPAGTQIASHRHHAEDELVIVLAGTLEVVIDGRTLRRGSGQTVFIPRGTAHEVRAVTEVRHIAILARTSLGKPGAA